MTNLRTAAQQALEALENGRRVRACEGGTKYQPPLEDSAIAVLRAALEEQEQEPEGGWQSAPSPQVTQRIADMPMSEYRRGVHDGFKLGLREGRIKAEDEMREQQPVAWSDARLRGIASDYFPDAKDWPAAMLCLRHLLMEQAKYQLALSRVPLAQQQEQEQEQEADYPEEKLQAVAEYISDKYHVWYGVAARDIEEVLRQSVRCGLVSNPPRREWQSLTGEEIQSIHDTYHKRMGPQEFARSVEQACKERNT